MSKIIEYLVLKPVVIEYTNGSTLKHDKGSIYLSYESREEAEEASKNGKYPIYELEGNETNI